MEHQIISALLKSREFYEKFKRIGKFSDFSPIGQSVGRAIDEYYGTDPSAERCGRDLIEERVIGRLTNTKHAQAHRDYMGAIDGDVSAPNVERAVFEVHRRAAGAKLSLALANGASEKEVDALIREYQEGGSGRPEAAQSAVIDVFDTSDLIEGKPNVDYIKLWPKPLNDRLDGGALRGHHVLVFARPETGKTLFAVNLVAGFTEQRLHVLYVNNEEPVADIRDRIRGRSLRISKNDVRRSPGSASERLSQVARGTVSIIESVSFDQVRACLGGYKRRGVPPCDVVVLDQVRNMRLKADSRTVELEAAGIEARAIAKEFNVLVVSVTQAGGSADNKVYLEMSDVDSSKTGIPASADLMIGIGGDSGMKTAGMLGISLPKNKLSGLHDRFVVTADFSTGVIT